MVNHHVSPPFVYVFRSALRKSQVDKNQNSWCQNLEVNFRVRDVPKKQDPPAKEVGTQNKKK